ncbi:MAG TPA: BatA and WFA domain-containing protein [Planctomycetota bacterium]|nr:BatA and WFA domain-containing protein [Planctomycetota bacterium]
MSLLNPIFLLGLGAIGVPIILHLIQRQRYPERPFTTLRFFDKTIKHNVIKRRFVDKLLLVLRILILAALMIALARPFAGVGVGEKRMSLVIVLDNSPSMGRADGGQALFEQATAAADSLLQQLGPQDRAGLVLSTREFSPAFTRDRLELERQVVARKGQPTGLIVQTNGGQDGRRDAPVGRLRRATGTSLLAVPGLTGDPEVIRKAIAAVSPDTAAFALCGYGFAPEPQLSSDCDATRQLLSRAVIAGAPGDMHKAMQTARELLARSGDGDRAIVVFSDLQAGDWHSSDPVDMPGIAVRVVELGVPDNSVNLAIDDCIVPARKVRFGQRVLCAARVCNLGSAASAPGTALAVKIGGQKTITKVPVPSLAPGARELVSFEVPAVARGEAVFGTVDLQCPGDPFTYDNTWHFQVPLRPPMRVLCVNAEPGDGPGRSAFFVVNALIPRTPAAQAAPFADVDECVVPDLLKKDLFPYNVIILAGAGKLEAKARERLRAFVEDGGGLVVFPDCTAENGIAEEYNGWGFLPARVQGLKTREFVYIKTISDRAPAMAAMAELGGAAVQGLSTSAWLDIAAEGQPAVLARFSNGSPCIVEGALGKGRVVLAAAGAHASCSDWPLAPAFVVLIRELAWYLSDSDQGRVASPERRVGEGLAMTIPPEMRAGAAGAFRMGITGVAIEYEPLPYLRRGQSLLLPWADRPGHYVLSIQPGGVLPLDQPGLGAAIAAASVNHSVDESRLATLPADSVKAMVKAASIEVAPAGGKDELTIASLRTGRDLWRWLALLAVGILFAESLIAWRKPTDAAN